MAYNSPEFMGNILGWALKDKRYNNNLSDSSHISSTFCISILGCTYFVIKYSSNLKNVLSETGPLIQKKKGGLHYINLLHH